MRAPSLPPSLSTATALLTRSGTWGPGGVANARRLVVVVPPPFAGLDYAPCNELLWRPSRPAAVDLHAYRPLSPPATLLEVDAMQHLVLPAWHARASPNQGTTDPEDGQQQGDGAEPAAAAAAASGVPRRPWSATLRCAAAGRLDCVVAWQEYELAPGAWLSYAPALLGGAEQQEETAGGGDGEGDGEALRRRQEQAQLRPHVWQRVHFFPVRPQVRVTDDDKGADVAAWRSRKARRRQRSSGCDGVRALLTQVRAGQRVRVTATLGSKGAPGAPGVLRLELEEELLLEEPLSGGQEEGEEGAGAGDGLPAGEPLGDDGDEEEAEEGAGGEEEEKGKGGSAGASLILPYHLCMLNDHDRTAHYRRAIQREWEDVWVLSRWMVVASCGPDGHGGGCGGAAGPGACQGARGGCVRCGGKLGLASLGGVRRRRAARHGGAPGGGGAGRRRRRAASSRALGAGRGRGHGAALAAGGASGLRRRRRCAAGALEEGTRWVREEPQAGRQPTRYLLRLACALVMACGAGVERELPLVMAANALAQANGLQHRVLYLNTQCSRLQALAPLPASAPPAGKAATGGGAAEQPPEGGEQAPAAQAEAGQGPAALLVVQAGEGGGGEGAVAAAAAAGTGVVRLRRPPALVVHEVFGSDPLSEHILTTMRHVKVWRSARVYLSWGSCPVVQLDQHTGVSVVRACACGCAGAALRRRHALCAGALPRGGGAGPLRRAAAPPLPGARPRGPRRHGQQQQQQQQRWAAGPGAAPPLGLAAGAPPRRAALPCLCCAPRVWHLSLTSLWWGQRSIAGRVRRDARAGLHAAHPPSARPGV